MTDICYTVCIPETFQITIKKNFSFKKVFLMSHCFGFGRFGYDSYCICTVCSLTILSLSYFILVINMTYLFIQCVLIHANQPLIFLYI